VDKLCIQIIIKATTTFTRIIVCPNSIGFLVALPFYSSK
jgi:hypothetical protein